MATITQKTNPYIDGLTMDEVKNYINTLPMTEDERAEILAFFENKTERKPGRPTTMSHEKRVENVTAYLEEHGSINGPKIGELAKLQGSSLCVFIRRLKGEGVIEKADYWNFRRPTKTGQMELL